MSVSKYTKNRIANDPIWKRILATGKSEKLPGFKNISLHNTLKYIREQVVWDDLIERASAISFNSAMALPPSILFLCTLIPLFPIRHQFETELHNLIISVIPGKNNYSAIILFIDDILNRPRNVLMLFGFLLSIFFSSNAMMGVMRSFDKNYPGFTKRRGIKKRLAAIRITLTLFLLLFLCLGLLIAQESVLTWLGIQNELLAATLGKLRWILIFLLVFIIISYIYRHAPSVDKKWKLATPGSLLATCLVVLCTLIFSWWVSSFGSYNKLYGSIGTVIVLMVLIFLSSLILLIGFELNAGIYTLSRTKEVNATQNEAGMNEKL